jgi:NADP-dependent 3-hydroxy acid dehydrogenase YdfG
MRQNILITGASSGLGAEMARQFAARGRSLALCARRADRLEALRDELAPAQVAIRTLDVNDYDAVPAAFTELRDELGGVDRVIVNAGLGKGARIGTGRFDANRATALTNFVGGLAQCEAAMSLFRAANAGHLVVVSSMSALRGMPGAITTYAATKAGLAALAEGIRSDVLGSPIRVTTLFPGYIRSEMNERVKNAPFMVPTETGERAMVDAIEKEKPHAHVPPWPWVPLGLAMKHLPLPLARRLMG